MIGDTASTTTAPSTTRVLDRGYVRLVESWGSDRAVVEAARMSTDKGFLGWGVEGPCDRCLGSGTNEPENGPGSLCKQCQGRRTFIKPGDEKLLRYLWEHRHATPFEMAGAIFEVKAPIFVFREWHRHRTQSYNEMSGRYVALPDENYVPDVLRLGMGVGVANKQASGRAVAEADALAWLAKLADAYEHAQRVYQEGIDLGIPKEIARLPVPVARYSRMRASANLRNWLGFLTLRLDTAAQWEIRQYAEVVHGELVSIFPRTMALFDEGAGR